MEKRYIARVTRVGSGLGIIIPAQFVRELGIFRGEYLELHAHFLSLFYCTRLFDQTGESAEVIKF